MTTSAGELSEQELLLARWRATGLPTATPGAAAVTAAAEVARLGAVQAQEFEMTLWSLGRRTGLPREDVLAAYVGGDIVRTHTLRPTWHFVHRDDLAMVQTATAPRVHRTIASTRRHLGLTDDDLVRCGDVITEAAARPVDRSTVRQALDRAGVDTTGQRLAHILMWAELECLVASGPMAGRQHTYLAWAPLQRPERDDAIRRLVERFLSSHGPASRDDVAAWSSLTKAEVDAAVADLGTKVERAPAAGREWMWIGELTDHPWDSPQVELINGYDEYISGFSASGKRLLDRAAIYRGEPGTPVGIVMVDGQLAGHWRRTATRTDLRIEVIRLRRWSKPELESLQRNAAQLAEFAGLAPSLAMTGE